MGNYKNFASGLNIFRIYSGYKSDKNSHFQANHFGWLKDFKKKDWYILNFTY